jgi:predicted AlkP superfamily pyrophosphatase or phosphodiesterase
LPGAPGKADQTFYRLWEDTPWADAYLARMATAALQHYKMGQGSGTDFLAVSFSTLDLVGHAFGPRSHEVQDVLARLDATLGQLLESIDRFVGPDRYVVALTGDHGVSPVPEQMAAEGLAAGRISGQDLQKRINAALTPWFGEGAHTQALVYTDLYFKPGVYQKLLAQPEAMRAAIDAIESTPGVWRAIRSDDVTEVHLGVDRLALTVLYSYSPGRSGDILIVPQPYYLNSTAAATHGTGYRYDARVPVVLAGPGIRPGEYTVDATPADIVPTLAYLAGVTMPRTDGRVLREALDAGAPDPAVRSPTGGAAAAARGAIDRKQH